MNPMVELNNFTTKHGIKLERRYIEGQYGEDGFRWYVYFMFQGSYICRGFGESKKEACIDGASTCLRELSAIQARGGFVTPAKEKEVKPTLGHVGNAIAVPEETAIDGIIGDVQRLWISLKAFAIEMKKEKNQSGVSMYPPAPTKYTANKCAKQNRVHFTAD